MSAATMTGTVRAAIVDLYADTPNQGMRCIREILARAKAERLGGAMEIRVFDTRGAAEMPDPEFDLFVSTGGPGSPYEGVGSPWEDAYFRWLDAVWKHNQSERGRKKHVFAICHSFELVCRFFGVAEVTKRRSPSFGILPIHKTEAGQREPLFAGLSDPFFAADFREWQVVQPNHARLAEIGAEILSLEKVRPHVPLERAVTGIRFSPEIAGVQFHPEAEPATMTRLFTAPEKREQTIRDHGEEKYERIIRRIAAEDGLAPTYRTVLPRFLETAIAGLARE